MLKLVFADQGWEDLSYWISYDRKIATRLLRLIDECIKSPFEGLGKPEPLRENYSGYWSRRIELPMSVGYFTRCLSENCGSHKQDTTLLDKVNKSMHTNSLPALSRRFYDHFNSLTL